LSSGSWATDTDDNNLYDDPNRPLSAYANYTLEHHDGHTPAEYDMSYDWYGPQFFFPLHCLKTFDY
jgi:hypothetical protein